VTFLHILLSHLLGDDVWNVAKFIVMQGVNIGQGAIVGTGSLVTKDVPPYAIVVGSPANIIRYRFSESTIEMLLNNALWKKQPSEFSEGDKLN
jgi:acetyltransferase-like isoleucine patch superfamily enzyme